MLKLSQMKKISFLFAALATTMGFTSCDESKDNHSTLNPNDGVVVEEFLNTPEMTNMSVELTAENASETFHMTCSQPSYGYAASARYEVEISFSEDFVTPAAEGLPASLILPTAFYDCSAIDPSYGEVATAMCEMLGVKNEKAIPTGYYEIYARLIANVEAVGGSVVPNTTYQSNVVKMTRANCVYLAVIIPGEPTGIYLRGGMNDWGAVPEYEFLTTDKAGVYAIESCAIGEGVEFKVADANWADINYGHNGTDIEFGKPYELAGPDNPGNLMMTKAFSGRVQLTVAAGKYTLLLEAAEPETPGLPSGIYLRGDMNGWDTSMEFLTTEFKNSWIIEGVTIAADQTFKVADANWSAINLGAGDVALEFDKAFDLVSGGNNIAVPEAFTGSVQLAIQGGVYKMTLVTE